MIEYPEETEGSRIARENRVMANNLSAEERERLLDVAVKIIHQGEAMIEKPDPSCPNCLGQGYVDTGGVTPWEAPIYRPCGCLKKTQEKQETK